MIDAGTNLGLGGNRAAFPASVDVAETGDMNANAKAILGVNPHSVARQRHARQRHYDRSFDAAGRRRFRSSGGYQSERFDAGEMAIVPTFGLGRKFSAHHDFRRRFRSGSAPQPLISVKPLNDATAARRFEKTFQRRGKLRESSKDAYAKDKTLPYPTTDLKMEAMTPYVRGEKPVIFTAERERDIRGVVKFAEK
jgi:hypothetical protein